MVRAAPTGSSNRKRRCRTRAKILASPVGASFRLTATRRTNMDTIEHDRRLQNNLAVPPKAANITQATTRTFGADGTNTRGWWRIRHFTRPSNKPAFQPRTRQIQDGVRTWLAGAGSGPAAGAGAGATGAAAAAFRERGKESVAARSVAVTAIPVAASPPPGVTAAAAPAGTAAAGYAAGATPLLPPAGVALRSAERRCSPPAAPAGAGVEAVGKEEAPELPAAKPVGLPAAGAAAPTVEGATGVGDGWDAVVELTSAGDGRGAGWRESEAVAGARRARRPRYSAVDV